MVINGRHFCNCGKYSMPCSDPWDLSLENTREWKEASDVIGIGYRTLSQG
jgi:hypothetical protein